MFSRICGEILAMLLLTTILLLRLVLFLSNEKEAVEMDFGQIEGWLPEHSFVYPKLEGKESNSETAKAFGSC